MQINDFVSQGGPGLCYYTNQRRVTSDIGEFCQVSAAHFPALTRQFKQSVLVNGKRNSIRQSQRGDGIKPVDVLQHVFTVDFTRRLK